MDYYCRKVELSLTFLVGNLSWQSDRIHTRGVSQSCSSALLDRTGTTTWKHFLRIALRSRFWRESCCVKIVHHYINLEHAYDVAISYRKSFNKRPYDNKINFLSWVPLGVINIFEGCVLLREISHPTLASFKITSSWTVAEPFIDFWTPNRVRPLSV